MLGDRASVTLGNRPAERAKLLALDRLYSVEGTQRCAENFADALVPPRTNAPFHEAVERGRETDVASRHARTTYLGRHAGANGNGCQTMNPLDLLGVCEVRRLGVVYPRRKKLAFVNALVEDDPRRRRTLITPQAAQAFSADIGADDWSASVGDTRYYDADGDGWFALEPEFSGAPLVYLTTINDDDDLVIRSLPGEPAQPSKLLFNRGPGTIRLVATDTAPNSLRVTGGTGAVLVPEASVRVLWDAVDSRWIVVHWQDGATPGALHDEGGSELTDESGDVLTQE